MLGFKSEMFVLFADAVHAMAVRGVGHMQRVREGVEVKIAFLTAAFSGEQVAATQTFKSEMDDFAHDGTQVDWLC